MLAWYGVVPTAQNCFLQQFHSANFRVDTDLHNDMYAIPSREVVEMVEKMLPRV